ncbi:MAG: OmpW family outer membrane protein [Rickettsiales bacterium]
MEKSWDAKERFMIRGRILNVMPDERTYTSIGGKVTADNSFVPEVDFTYFFTDHFAAELIAAVSPHDMGAVNTGLGNLDLGSVWLLPYPYRAISHKPTWGYPSVCRCWH